jgi:hypothetical protein
VISVARTTPQKIDWCAIQRERLRSPMKRWNPR